MTGDLKQTPDMTGVLIRDGLDRALQQIAQRLAALSGPAGAAPPFEIPEHSAFVALRRIFGLRDPELELLALLAGNELDESIGQAIAALNGTGLPDLALAERLVGPVLWDVICPEAPLRHWRLVELSGSGPMRSQVLRLDERILHALLGTAYLDGRLAGLLHPCAPAGAAQPPGRLRDAAERIADVWRDAAPLPVILIGGRDAQAARDVATGAAARLSLRLWRIDAADIPTDWGHRATLVDLLDRELALSDAAVLIEARLPSALPAAADLAGRLGGPTILAAEDPPPTERAARLRLDLDPAGTAERIAQWRRALGPAAADALGDDLSRLAGQFSLDGPAIAAAASMARVPGLAQDRLAPALWQAARQQGRRALDGLAERIDSRAGWDMLVLPADQTALLRDLEAHLRAAWRVNEPWGWAARSPRGLGATALFSGPSGTGKTLAAEVLAGALQLDLFRIDLSQVVSKYIGETEKNLARIFDAAEQGGAILLFDEADALFGKRSEVRDSHDRYANIEISYLLQKMEAYRGLAVLTTNQKSALDTAFLRRLRYVVNFPFPDAAARAEIWARIFPASTPQEGLSTERLARLNLSGGSIRSVALNATYLAAAGPGPVTMQHLQRAARREYAKLEKPFTPAEQEAFR